MINLTTESTEAPEQYSINSSEVNFKSASVPLSDLCGSIYFRFEKPQGLARPKDSPDAGDFFVEKFLQRFGYSAGIAVKVSIQKNFTELSL